MIRENLEYIRSDIANVCASCGRDASEVTLIAVSKLKPNSDISEAIDAGQRDFGENWVQELKDKIPAFPEDINWHLIGHLQKNKVKYIVDKVKYIHSVDSVDLAAQIEKECVKKNCECNILLEVNVAREESKSGFFEEDLMSAVEEIAKFSHVHIKGLMTVAPFVEDPEENRVYFRKLKHLLVDIQNKKVDNVQVDVLSMGMTNDYKIAIEEGATMVRIGTAIFGARDYSK
ncbi:MAG: YggS family pyridoxal phosphate-dependent enzyme [Lachnospiraceae bacterium]|nr:YggS family pyridoxal phosphate-dependent enzyme [Lachnospiraceae bacterium]